MNVKNLKMMLLLVAVTVCFVGCSKDDEPATPNPLLGVWGWVDTLDYGNDNIRIITGTYTYNSNWTFNHNLLVELNGSVDKQDDISGTYSIHDKDKVTLTIIDPIKYIQTLRFKKGQDEKGEYIVFVFDILGDSDKLYKVK